MSQQAATLFNSTEFASHIGELKELLSLFLETLKSESDLLKLPPSDQLTKTLQQKSELAEQLQTSQHSLESFLKTSELQHLSQVLAPPHSEHLDNALKKQIQDVLTLSQACSDLNLANGISVQMLSNINQASLRILSGGPEQTTNTYSAKGETQTGDKRSPIAKA
ncbi:flagellar protein FlgN [Thiomicrorhabdus sp. zzn3]|uniref:flagellar protein FlgN n=1 Tax=Thiomicrorhabdus sp. zzn3 TaxID=3039775 RepID=UPI0024366011|nr:flagellar protein FlgN [Thiomicrorhabdus sp. zzn3]MDG6777589.1 flagellar protein FlgN [Thiomicrorhabdus sp. zzn3]